MKTFLNVLCLLWVLAGLLMPTLSAQTVRAKVTLQADRLQPEDQDILNEVPRNLEEYINNYRWGEEDEELVIYCDFSIVIESMVERSGQRIYRGQLLVSSMSGENFLDKPFEFPYQRGQLMEHVRGTNDPLLTVIDYYVYMIIAGEMDTFLLLGGSRYYDLARRFVAEGQISAFSSGWRNRQEQLELITNSDHIPLRQAKFYYYEGLFYIEERNDTEKAPEYSKKVVELLAQVFENRPNSPALKRFLDAHYLEFCKLFRYDKDRRNLFQMMRIDNRHRETYERCVVSSGTKFEP